jgi:L-amino acid N-acyltransferase YncA
MHDGNDEVVIRPAASGDMAAVAEIYGESVVNGVASYELVAPDAAEMQRRFQSIRDGGFPWFVAEIGGQTVGYAYASPFRLRPAYRYLVEDSVYLHRQWRRRGIGGQLLSLLIADCERSGYRQMVAVIGGGAASSIELHRRYGFAICGTMEGSGFKFGRWLDTVLMQRPLGEGASTLPESQSLS